MKKFKTLLYFFVLMLVISSCAKESVEIKTPKKTKEEILPQVEYKIFRVEQATRKSATETFDMLSDTLYKLYVRDLSFFFYQGRGHFYGGHSIPNTQFPVTAKTFSLLTRIQLPTSFIYNWDEDKGTIVFKTSGVNSYFPILPDGKTAYLDTSDFVMYKTLEEAQSAAIPPYIKVILEEDDPKLGPVTYNFTLKPIWFYFHENQNYEWFVMF